MLSRFMTRREQLVLCFVAAAIVLGSGVLLLKDGEIVERNPEPTLALVTPTDSVPVIETIESLASFKQSLVVSVQGAVLEAGVYEFSSEQRVNDAIKEAGGTLSMADMEGLNLAAKLVDGTTLYVPKKRYGDGNKADSIEGPKKNHAGYLLGGASEAGGVSVPTENSSGLININTASQAELESLPGIGPVMHRRLLRIGSRDHFSGLKIFRKYKG